MATIIDSSKPITTLSKRDLHVGESSEQKYLKSRGSQNMKTTICYDK